MNIEKKRMRRHTLCVKIKNTKNNALIGVFWTADIHETLEIYSQVAIYSSTSRFVFLKSTPCSNFHQSLDRLSLECSKRTLSAYKLHRLIVNYHRFPHRDESKDENHRCLEIEWISQPRLPDSIVLLKHCHWRNYGWVKVRRFHYRSYCISNERCSVTVFCLAQWRHVCNY